MQKKLPKRKKTILRRNEKEIENSGDKRTREVNRQKTELKIILNRKSKKL